MKPHDTALWHWTWADIGDAFCCLALTACGIAGCAMVFDYMARMPPLR
jgi:hypothetical protein